MKAESIGEIFEKYFVERRWGWMYGLKEPKIDDLLGIRFFGIINFITFLTNCVFWVLFVWTPLLAGGFGQTFYYILVLIILFLSCVSSSLGLIYYIYLRDSWFYIILYAITVIISFAFTYYWLFFFNKLFGVNLDNIFY